MHSEYGLALIEAIRNHPEIEAAALTGSRARAGGITSASRHQPG